jgi:phosphoribosylglycinamide formyltransferase-1
MTAPLRLAVLISGGGMTLQNLIDRVADGRLPARIVGVVSSRTEVQGVERARKAGLPVEVIERPKSTGEPGVTTSQTLFPARVWAAIRGFAPDLVCFAGWLHLLPILEEFHNKVLNIHPSLLPAFGGKGMHGRHVHEAVLAAGVRVSGCTVHFADDTFDTGPILVQRCVPVVDHDDPNSLARRVFAAECEAYPEAIRLIAENRVSIRGRRVVISG